MENLVYPQAKVCMFMYTRWKEKIALCGVDLAFSNIMNVIIHVLIEFDIALRSQLKLTPAGQTDCLRKTRHYPFYVPIEKANF